ncbi:MAG: methyltransferase domain-containing protein [Bacteroidales bacterium]
MDGFKRFLKNFFPHSFLVWLKSIVLKVRFWGRKYHCPLCNSNVGLLKPLGFDFPVLQEMQIVGGGKRNTLCPVCNSSDRIRLNYIFLKQNSDIFSQPAKLLHLAPEPALKSIFLKHKNIDYITADLYQENVMVKMDITKIQFPDHTFDAIICNHILEHIPNDRQAMKELYRVLKPGGWAILQVPLSKILRNTLEDPTVVSEDDRERVFGQKDHVRIYGLDYPERLRNAGFRVTEYKWTEDNNLKNPGNRLGLNKDEVVFYCQK